MESAGTGSALPRETHTGTLKIGDVEIPCAVLDGGRRMISATALSSAFGQGQHGGSAGENGQPQVPRFLTAKNLNPFIPADFFGQPQPTRWLASDKRGAHAPPI
jgi:hypothetical protein